MRLDSTYDTRLRTKRQFSVVLDNRSAADVYTDIARDIFRVTPDIDVKRFLPCAAEDLRTGRVRFCIVHARHAHNQKRHLDFTLIERFAAKKGLIVPSVKSGLVAIEDLLKSGIWGRLVVAHKALSYRLDGAQSTRWWRIAYRHGHDNPRITLVRDWMLDHRYSFLYEHPAD